MSNSTPNNTAAWLPAANHPLQIQPAPIPTPGPRELILRVRAVALNPVDAYMFKLGILIPSYPYVLGCDVAGEVYAVGAEVKRFRVGERVMALQDHSGPGTGKERRDNVGCFQQFCAVEEGLAGRLPEGVGFREGCVLPMGICVAGTSLFERSGLGLELPVVVKGEVESRKKGMKGQVAVVWGGGSSMGSCGIQMAKAAGYEVAAICGERNFEYCRGIGADYVFNYNKESIVEDVVSALHGKELAGVFDAVMPADTIIKSAQIAHGMSGRKHVATVMVGQGAQVVPGGLPEDVTTSYCWGSALKDTEVGKAIWGEWVTAALSDGSLLCKPAPEVVGRGLEDLEGALELMYKGVSATKLIVEIP